MKSGGSDEKNIISNAATAHPCCIQVWADGSLVERTGRFHRVDRDAPNKRSVAQMKSELLPETCFHSNGALIACAGRHRRVDRDSPNERYVAQARAELLPET